MELKQSQRDVEIVQCNDCHWVGRKERLDPNCYTWWGEGKHQTEGCPICKSTNYELVYNDFDIGDIGGLLSTVLTI